MVTYCSGFPPIEHIIQKISGAKEKNIKPISKSVSPKERNGNVIITMRNFRFRVNSVYGKKNRQPFCAVINMEMPNENVITYMFAQALPGTWLSLGDDNVAKNVIMYL